MPIGLGIGVSHAPGMYMKTQAQWDAIWNFLSLSKGIPQPATVAEDTGEQLAAKMARIEAGHAELKRQFDAYAPDILIIIGGDQSEMFDRSNVPQLMIYLGEHAEGHRPGGLIITPGEPPKREPLPPVELNVDVDFSKWLLHRLVKQENFDIAFSDEAKSLGRPANGVPHAFANPASYLIDDVMTPTVLIYENTYDPPSLSAKRCYDLGAAIARITRHEPRRIAILGSGGLAHDPYGKRSGWLDQPMDRWFLERLAQGEGKATQALYTFNSDTMVGGTGENRAWITVAGAMETMGSRANIIDYVEAPKTATGLGFAYWRAEA